MTLRNSYPSRPSAIDKQTSCSDCRTTQWFYPARLATPISSPSFRRFFAKEALKSFFSRYTLRFAIRSRQRVSIPRWRNTKFLLLKTEWTRNGKKLELPKIQLKWTGKKLDLFKLDRNETIYAIFPGIIVSDTSPDFSCEPSFSAKV